MLLVGCAGEPPERVRVYSAGKNGVDDYGGGDDIESPSTADAAVYPELRGDDVQSRLTKLWVLRAQRLVAACLVDGVFVHSVYTPPAGDVWAAGVTY